MAATVASRAYRARIFARSAGEPMRARSVTARVRIEIRSSIAVRSIFGLKSDPPNADQRSTVFSRTRFSGGTGLPMTRVYDGSQVRPEVTAGAFL